MLWLDGLQVGGGDPLGMPWAHVTASESGKVAVGRALMPTVSVTTAALREAGLREQVHLLVGGAPATASLAD